MHLKSCSSSAIGKSFYFLFLTICAQAWGLCMFCVHKLPVRYAGIHLCVSLMCARKFKHLFFVAVYFYSPVPPELPLSFHLQKSIQLHIIQKPVIEQAVQ